MARSSSESQASLPGQNASLQVSALSVLLFWLLAAPLAGLLAFQRWNL